MLAVRATGSNFSRFNFQLEFEISFRFHLEFEFCLPDDALPVQQPRGCSLMEGTFLALRHISADILQLYPHLTVYELDMVMSYLIESLGGNDFNERLPRIMVELGEQKPPKQMGWVDMAIAKLREVVAVDLIDASIREREKVVAEFIRNTILYPPPGTPRFSEILDRVRRQQAQVDKVFAREGKKPNLSDPISAAVAQLEEEIEIALPQASRLELEFVAAQLIGEAIHSVAAAAPNFKQLLIHVRSQGGEQ